MPAKPLVTIRGVPVPVYTYKSSSSKNRVSLIETVTVKPGQEVQLQARVNGPDDSENTPCLLEPTKTLFPKTGVLVARVLTTPKQETCCVRLMNASILPVKLWRGMSLGTLQEVEEQRCYSTATPPSTTATVGVVEAVQQQIDSDLANVDKLKKSPYSVLPPHIDELYQRSIAELDEEQQRDLYQLLCVYQDTFAKDANDIGTKMGKT